MTTVLELRPLTQDLQTKAIEELNEVPERIADDLKALKEWILKQPYLKARLEDQFLIAFLRGCKYSLEKAKKKIDGYYTMRTNLPDLFESFCDEQRVRAIIRMGVALHLPLSLQNDGPRLVLIRTGHYDPDVVSLYELMKINILKNDLLMLNDDNCVISGFIQLLDFEEFTSKHFFHFQPAKMKMLSHYIEEALPMRNKASHFFNTGATFESAFVMLKPLLPAKVQDRMMVHPDLESLYNHVPQKFLPKEYGGENGCLEELISSGEEFIMKYREYLLEEKQYGTDESLRPGKPLDFDTIFGVEGSFRKLNVD